MKNYEVIGAVMSLQTGLLRLNDEQASARSHLLEKVGAGIYALHGPTQFIRGEVFGYDGDLSPTQALELLDVKANSRAAAVTKNKVVAAAKVGGGAEKKQKKKQKEKASDSEADQDDAGSAGSEDEESTAGADDSGDAA